MSLNPIVDFSIVQIVFNRIRVSLRIFFFFQRNGECTYRFNDIHFSSVSDRVKKKNIFQTKINQFSIKYIYIYIRKCSVFKHRIFHYPNAQLIKN